MLKPLLSLRTCAVSVVTSVLVASVWETTALAEPGPVPDRLAILARVRAFFAVEREPQNVEIGKIVERFPDATVRFRGPVEGSALEGVLRFRHYDFGWQLVDLRDSRLRGCDIDDSLSDSARSALLLPSAELPPSKQPCPALLRHVRPVTADEVYIRSLLQSNGSEAFDPVNIVGNYALVAFGGHGGGKWVFAKRAGTWRKIGGGGGLVDAGVLLGYGIPAGTARLLIDPAK